MRRPSTRSGRGERLAALPGLPEGRIVILAPAEPVSTGRVYGALDGFRPAAGEASERLAAALREGTVPAPSEWLVNDLEAPAARVSAAVAADQAAMAALGAAGGRLSGSGGAWFTVVPEAAAAGVQVAWAQVWPGRASWITRPVDYGWRRVG